MCANPFSAPKKAPAPAAAPPPAPTKEDVDVQEEGDKERRRRARNGRGSTALTGALGLAGQQAATTGGTALTRAR
jgi:hypothetical protein